MRRLPVVCAVIAVSLSAQPALAQAEPDRNKWRDITATDDVADQGDDSSSNGPGPSCTYVPVTVSRNGTVTDPVYRYTYIDAMAFRIVLASAVVQQHMYRTCTYADGRITNDHVWVTISEPDPAVLIPGTVEEVTERVFAPEPALSPVSRGIVNVGMWLAVEGGDPVSATASASDTTWAQTTATLRDTTFDFGNGDSITCAGAGDPIPEWAKDSAEPSPICGYTYRSTNGGEPYRLTITSTWSVVSTTSAGTVQQQPDIVLSTTIDYVVREVVTTGVSG